MKKTLFVAGLDFNLTDAQVKGVFEKYGTVESAKIITDKFSGRSRGFGFVEMSSQEEAEECIRVLNNASVNGRQIAVKFKEDKPAGSSNTARRW
ncbi:RNA recognition motif domain-containing protein [Aquella oligotrophica]|uniref:RNA-binding protein n=1 Tax=Aquella oligotrophica TaxID=2067065 RepID=A0A2I7N3C9_9NEIS|nr:RNA-binding protein [Aquella oligotrophica]AUR50964.1 RNA-binding protein [Aquella oligotrophica]